jgi:hypothetical protein
MKMRLSGFLAFAVLSISILSYGVSGSVFATEHNIPPVFVEVDSAVIGNGGTVTISGMIKNYDSSAGKGLTFLVKSPDNNIVTIGQLIPNSDGSFEKRIVAGGPLWKLSGDYVVDFHYGADKGEIIINYVGGEFVGSEPPPVDKEPPPVDKEPPPVDKEPPPVDKEPDPTCGAGTELVNGICQVIRDKEPEAKGGGCLIATAAYGTELAPQVQFLREIRDNTVMSTASGTAFMTGFNQLYYSFSPTIADMERENPMFQEVVRAFITPMVSTLSIMTLAEDGSEVEVLGLGISVIALNLGMYIAAPALIGFKVHNHFKSRK